MSDAPEFDRAPASSFAYVTLVTNRDYVLGASALLRSLRRTDTGADLVVLFTPGVDEQDLSVLRPFKPRLGRCGRLPTSAEFNQLHERGRLHAAAPFTKGGKPVFHTPLDNFVKLRLWQLDEYEKVVFIDADALVLKNCDKLFSYPEFCAAPNVYEGLADFQRMNSGVFTARPDRATFDAMLSQLDRPGTFWRRTDQSFLESFFPDWHGLPVYYNMLQYVWFNLPDLWDWGQIHVLHYQYEKPWQAGHEKAERLRLLIDLWQAYASGDGIPDDLSGLPGPEAPADKRAS
ncbi:glycosyltransferase [Roseibium marinum]|uniref:Alpha-N-acetylglucosamine transferase n=1 Tax=Roseibium marinum TaxID=281252 RepID=A0A2S3UUY6_9HYPH|nr:glycosyltransferase family 8 protein [Roseibium marinum]POF31515.1 alpha-N-acetylglucosamine transferase [Roseibium marinum]